MKIIDDEARINVKVDSSQPITVNVEDKHKIDVVIGDAAKMDCQKAINYIESGKAEIESAVEIGINDFNSNALIKTSEFNTNANNKTNAFNSNATLQTTYFNDNATSKTKDFNDNYSAKKALIDAEVGIAKQWAIGDPSEPTGGSAKYWANEASSVVGNCANKDLSNLSATGEAKFVKPSEIATVATTGSYNDLLNKPTIPAAQVNSDWNAVSGVAEILNKPTIPTVNNATLTLTQGGVSKGTFTANASSDVTIDLDAGGSGYHPDLLSFQWSDHLLNNVSWLRADTFSWQDGTVYSNAYKHLVNDIGFVRYMIPDDGFNNKFYRSPSEDTTMFAWTNSYSTLYTESEFPENGDNFYYHDQIFGTVLSTGAEAGSEVITPTTETIGSYTITVYVASDGHKIVLADQETVASNIYSESGVAWYFILDTVNQRFKLPRTKFGFTGYRDAVGKYVEAGLPNITGTQVFEQYGAAKGTSSGAFTNSESNSYANCDGGGGAYGNSTDLVFDASLSNPIYGNSTTVQTPATEMYLYFYVGDYTQTALEQTAGLNAELFNGKLDTSTPHIIETYKNGTSWYRIWSDGWCEQGGQSSLIADFGTDTITLLKPYANTNYTITKGTMMPSSGDDTSYNDATCIRYATKTTSSFQIYNRGSTDGGRYVGWMTCGYLS